MTQLTMEEISRQARPYPSYLLPRGGTALSLFSAGFHGWNDAIHMARSEMCVDCVDTDSDKLFEMSLVYPAGWEFHAEDAWEYAEREAARKRTWNVVSVDPFMGDAAERAWQTLYLWCKLARDLVTLTVHSDTHLNVPEGWKSSFFPRSSDVAWLVLRRA
jgi:hypothetical protein